MAKGKNPPPRPENIEALARLFDWFDFHVEADDFVLYELSNLIEQDRASFEDEEFRRIIDLGIHAHVEENLGLRAQMASVLRRAVDPAALKTIHALEDVDYPLRNVTLVMRAYTSYVFRRLEEIADEPVVLEEEARAWIARWQKGETPREIVSERLLEIGQPAVGPVADLLFDQPEDPNSAEFALNILALIRCSSGARVLAHAVLEPILPEELEMQAYKYTRTMWPLPRHYLLFQVSDHRHEDLPFRWFQLLVESDELMAVDLILDEVIAHGGDATYSEDLQVLIELLRLSHDPEVEEKIVALVNAPETPQDGVRLLQGLLSNFRPSAQPADNPWSRAAKLQTINRHYISAAKLFDEGKPDQTLRALDAVLEEQPNYAFALALRNLITSPR